MENLLLDESEDLGRQRIKVNSQISSQNNWINGTIDVHVGEHYKYETDFENKIHGYLCDIRKNSK